MSVLLDHSNNDDHDEPYYGIVRLINERKFAQIEWFEGNTFNPWKWTSKTRFELQLKPLFLQAFLSDQQAFINLVSRYFIQYFMILLKVVSTTFLLVCFVSLKESTCETGEKFVFHFKSFFCSWDNQVLTFLIFKCHHVINCLFMKHETHFTA